MPHVRARFGVQAGGRLVEEEHARAVDEAHGQVETALHAAGVRLGGPVCGVFEPEALQRGADAPAQVGAGDGIELALKREVLASGRLGVEPVALGDDADGMAHAQRVGEHVEPGHARGAAVGPGEGGEDAHGGGLARPVGAQQAEDGARRDG